VVVQSRAAATRQRILDAAVSLFCDHGYGHTGLNDIVDRAGVSMGSFYYHFGSKDALAAEIIAQGWPKAYQIVVATLGAPDAGLANVIDMTFAITDLLQRDRSVWLANHLNQAFGQLSEDGMEGFRSRAESFITGIAGCVRPGEVRDDITPTEAGDAVWMAVHGCHLLSDALRDDALQRLVASWRLLVRAMVPAGAQPHFHEVVQRKADHYAAARSAG